MYRGKTSSSDGRSQISDVSLPNKNFNLFKGLHSREKQNLLIPLNNSNGSGSFSDLSNFENIGKNSFEMQNSMLKLNHLANQEREKRARRKVESSYQPERSIMELIEEEKK